MNNNTSTGPSQHLAFKNQTARKDRFLLGTFNKRYFSAAMLLLIAEVLIALFVRDSFIRPYAGDVLVVILIYCVVKSFLQWSVITAVIAVLIFAFTIEFLQLIRIVDILGLENVMIARTVIGTSFSWGDLVAYMAGMGVVLLAETKWRRIKQPVI